MVEEVEDPRTSAFFREEAFAVYQHVFRLHSRVANRSGNRTVDGDRVLVAAVHGRADLARDATIASAAQFDFATRGHQVFPLSDESGFLDFLELRLLLRGARAS